MVRKQPDTFCFTLLKRMVRSASLLVNGTDQSVAKRRISALYSRKRSSRLIGAACAGNWIMLPDFVRLFHELHGISLVSVLTANLCSAGFTLALGGLFCVAVAGRGRRAVFACFTVVLFFQFSDELLYLCCECCYLLCQLCILRRLRFNDL